MSIFKTNKFFRVIKHFILAMPLMFILGVSLYTIVNPNAKDSYYGATINEEDYVYTSTLLPNYDYVLTNNEDLRINASTDYIQCSVSSIGFVTYDSTLDGLIEAIPTITSFRVYYNSNNGITSYQFVVPTRSYYVPFSNISTIDFTVTNKQVKTQYATNIYYIVYNPNSFLSNAFEYGMYQFNKIGFNGFDFVGLFNGIFIDQSTNVYCQFINSYINYYLMIECVYFVPWVIHFFIHICYDLGDKFINFKRDKKEDD